MLADLLHSLAKRWRRLRWRLLLLSSPLKLRYSRRVLAKGHQYPSLVLLGLLLRFPRHFPCQLPPPPRQITTYAPEAYMDEHYPDIFELRLVPVWRWRDTMQRSFYRLYEAFCSYDEPLIGYETEYFWKRQPGWNPELLRDPRDDGCTDPEQFAVLASLAETLIWSFNWRLGLGLRRDGMHVDNEDGAPVDYVPYIVPSWTAAAPVLAERLIVHKYPEDDIGGSDPDFDKRNIQATSAVLRTV